MKRLTATLVLLGLALTAMPAFAQEDGARPAPKILQIVIEDVKAGHGAAHEQTEMGWPKAYKASKAQVHFLAMTTITGPSEAWYVTGFPSVEAWEKQRMAEAADAALSAEFDRLSAADAEHINSLRNVVARYRDDLSHRPALKMGEYRYMNVFTVRVKPGMAGKFAESRKMIKAAHEKAGLTDYYSVFEVVSGMPGPTFLVFIPMKSLAEVDAAPGLHTSDAYKAAMGGELASDKLNELTVASVNFNDAKLFAFSPKMSNPAPEIVAASPDYWTPKAMAATTAAKAKTSAGKKEKE